MWKKWVRRRWQRNNLIDVEQFLINILCICGAPIFVGMWINSMVSNVNTVWLERPTYKVELLKRNRFIRWKGVCAVSFWLSLIARPYHIFNLCLSQKWSVFVYQFFLVYLAMRNLFFDGENCIFSKSPDNAHEHTNLSKFISNKYSEKSRINSSDSCDTCAAKLYGALNCIKRRAWQRIEMWTSFILKNARQDVWANESNLNISLSCDIHESDFPCIWFIASNGVLFASDCHRGLRRIWCLWQEKLMNS